MIQADCPSAAPESYSINQTLTKLASKSQMKYWAIPLLEKAIYYVPHRPGAINVLSTRDHHQCRGSAAALYRTLRGGQPTVEPIFRGHRGHGDSQQRWRGGNSVIPERHKLDHHPDNAKRRFLHDRCGRELGIITRTVQDRSPCITRARSTLRAFLRPELA